MRLNRSLIAAAALAAFFMPLSAHAGQGVPRGFSIPGPVIALGCFQATSVSVATSLATVAGGSIPTMFDGTPASIAKVQVETNPARWSDDGVHAPTASFGQPLANGVEYTFTSGVIGSAQLSNVKLIPTTSTMTIDACFYGAE